jgi:alkylation response protein AidB-like acyl-CoA dehydrogenase
MEYESMWEINQATENTIKRYCMDVMNSEVRPDAGERSFSRELWKKAGEVGILGIPIEHKWGGVGLSKREKVGALECIAMHMNDISFIASMHAHWMVSDTAIQKYGTEKQKEKFLGRLTKGEWVAALAFNELGSGSDILNTSTTVRKTDGAYKLNGVKTFITNGAVADVFYVLAKSEKGFITCLVPRDETITTSQIKTKNMPAAGIGEICFHDTVVPEENICNEEDQAISNIMDILNHARVHLVPLLIGGMNRILDMAIARVSVVKRNGKELRDHQSIQMRIADLKMQVDSTRAYGRSVMENYINNKVLEVFDINIAAAKVFCAENIIKAILELQRLYGHEGYWAESMISQWTQDFLTFSTVDGTQDVLKHNIGMILSYGNQY